AGKFTSAAGAAESFGRLPLSFEANQGQTDSRVRFLSQGPGYTLFLTSNEAILALRGSSHASNRAAGRENSSSVAMRLSGANPAGNIFGLEKLAGESNYFIGNDPTKWRTNIPNYTKVRYSGVSPGVDLVYYGNRGRLEYDFVVAAGGDPRAIGLEFESIDRDGTKVRYH